MKLSEGKCPAGVTLVHAPDALHGLVGLRLYAVALGRLTCRAEQVESSPLPGFESSLGSQWAAEASGGQEEAQAVPDEAGFLLSWRGGGVPACVRSPSGGLCGSGQRQQMSSWNRRPLGVGAPVSVRKFSTFASPTRCVTAPHVCALAAPSSRTLR